jgi:hypothetical protein
MESIALTLASRIPEQTKAKDPRAGLVEDFVKRLNRERTEENWKRYKKQLKKTPTLTKEEFKKMKLGKDERYLPDLTGRDVAIKMSHMSESDLYWFYKECSTAKCGFSRAWWGLLKINK